MSKIITIGREFGSGGREFGTRLAELLGFPYYDREIIAEIAKRTSLSEKYIQNIAEHKPVIPFPIHTGRTFWAVVPDFGQSVQSEQHSIIREVASKSDCVIVGRGADYILRESKPFRIFVYADMDSKVERCLARSENPDELPRKKLIKQIKSIDKNRARYYNYYTGKTWGDMLNYDICINTTNVNISDLVPHIAKMVKG